MRNKLLVLILGISTFGCSSNHGVAGYQKDEILATANDKPMPDWADETKPFQIKNNTVYSVGVTQIRGDEIPSAGARVSENLARSNIAKAVETRLEAIFQQGSENFSMESQTAKFIGSEVSSITTHSMRNEGTAWARVAVSGDDGSRRIIYRIYSLVTMPESDFKSAIQQAMNKGVAEHKVSQNFQKQLDKQWGRFVEGESAREPSSKEN